MNAKQEAIKALFLKDVAQHEVKIALDVGVHRRLVCRRPKSSVYWFEIVTWPGHLAIVGDVGSHVLRREHDMFDWFLGSLSNKAYLDINVGYWTQKLEAQAKGGVYQLNKERLREHCLEALDVHQELSKKKRAKTLERIEELVCDVSTEDEAHRRICKFKVNGEHFFEDTFEWDFREPTLQYTWCLFAIVWAIQKYNTMKAVEVPA